MALWGNKDDIYSVGTIAVDYAAKTITGTATTFTALSVGDVISIGVGNTFGEAVVSGITSDTVISIASTQYLSGAVISGVEWTASQKPKYTLEDSTFDNDNDLSATLKLHGVTGTATTNAGIGTDIIPVSVGSLDVIVGDAIVNDGNDIIISTIGTTTVSLASTISVGISTGDAIAFKRLSGGYFKDVFGVDQYEVGYARTTTVGGKAGAFGVTHSGWVGIMTYIDNHGNLRVKNEVLVAMSGITTGVATTTGVGGDAADDVYFQP
jgi:hypothetical protein